MQGKWLALLFSAFGCMATALASDEHDAEYYKDWPRAGSALELLKDVSREGSGLFLTRLDKSKVCDNVLSKLKDGEYEEIAPILRTDDSNAPELRQYRKTCPVKNSEGEELYDGDYLMEFFGHYNYRIYQIPFDGGRGEERNFLCADSDPEFSYMARSRCYFPDVRKCSYRFYKNRKAYYSPAGLPLAMIYKEEDGRIKIDGSYPFGMSVFRVSGEFYIISGGAEKVRDGIFYGFNLNALNYRRPMSCLWSYSTKSYSTK